MEFIEAKIENFGKFHEKKFVFESGLNSFLQENGWGKTTFCVFLKAMLYGMEQTSSKDLEKNERMKYFPWQKGIFGGSLTFKVNKKLYRVSRFFAEKKSGDTFELIDLQTNKFSNDFTENLGEELFYINKNSFERTILFFLNKKVESSSDLSSKLNNLIEDNEESNFENAIKILEKKSVLLKAKKGSGGEINFLENEIFEKQNFLIEAKQKLAENHLFEKQIQELNDKIENLKNEQAVLTTTLADSSKIQKKEIYNELLSNYKNLQTKKNELLSYLNENNDKNELKILTEKFLKNKSNSKTINEKIELFQEIQILKTKLLKLKEIQFSYKKSQTNFSIKKNALFTLNFLFFAISVFCLINKFYSIFFAGIFFEFICIILTIIFFRRKTQFSKTENNFSNLNNNILQLQKSIDSKEKDISDFVKSFGENENELFSSINKISVFAERFKFLKQKYFSSKKELADIEKEISFVKQKIQKFQKENISDFKTFNLPLNQEQNFSSENLKEKLSLISKKIIDKNEKLTEIKKNLENNFSFTDKIPDIEEKLDSLKQKLQEEKNNYKILSNTIFFLQSAKEKLDEHYSTPLKENFLKYIKLFSSELDFEIDTNLNVFLSQNSKRYESKNLSEGFKDLLDFCARLSLIDSIFKKERPPLILDDPFVNYDNLKVKTGLSLVKKLADENQIIYFTCHESRFL